MQMITAAGCWLPGPSIIAADTQEALDPVWYHMDRVGFSLEYIDESEARPDPLTKSELEILGAVWLRNQLHELDR